LRATVGWVVVAAERMLGAGGLMAVIWVSSFWIPLFLGANVRNVVAPTQGPKVP
jgi:hypothetical protein